MPKDKSLICIPTYNEVENVPRLFRQIKALQLSMDILFIDDNSPDGTGQAIDQLVARHPNVFAIHRQGKQGIGSAHCVGIAWAYQHGYDVLITMDCDFSHSPEDIVRFVQHSIDYDVVVGSRYMQKGSLKDWKFLRKMLTNLGHIMTKLFLGISYDASGAFRLYRLANIPADLFDLINSVGYSFFFESLFILHQNKFRIKEVPICLPARTYGHSKMNVRDAHNSLMHLVYIFIRVRLDRSSFLRATVSPVANTTTDQALQQQWDKYWVSKNLSSGLVYDTVASFYRQVIIRGLLTYFIKKYFSPGAKVLHAGCGGGQVYTKIVNYINISALDISTEALRHYAKLHGKSCTICQGSIFDLPVADNSFDGIYNLGVMEHFSEAQIDQILQEFSRVLRPQGKIVLFWPPEFGLSVIFLKFVHFILNKILKIKMRLHPDEITRIHSKKHALAILERNNLTLEQYSFGWRDLFTYVVVVARKKERVHPCSN